MGPLDLVRRLSAEGIRDRRVLEAILATPRERFVPAQYREHAWEDRPLPIGHGQTISQPYVVALMLELLELGGRERVLDVGTGSGYQAAILSRLAARVYSVEIVPELLDRARETLRALGIANVELRLGDGSRGWPEQAPFEAIVGAAAAPRVPDLLVEQLAPGGRLVLPVGPALGEQRIVRVRRASNGISTVEAILPVRFVPLVAGAPDDG